jgi:pyruvate dehydrogenase E2 component (dihydrolipoamide acetyltransferase)
LELTVVMPTLSPTMTEGNLVKWLKSEGDSVAMGEPLFEVETDKTVVEVEASEAGVLLRKLVSDGSEAVAVNAPLGIIIVSGAESARGASNAPVAAAEAVESAPAPARLSPNERRKAREAAAQPPQASSDEASEAVPIDGMRRAIAARVTRSAREVPQFDSSSDIVIGALERRRKAFNEREGCRATLNDVLVRALALALQEHPAANCSWGEDQMTRWKSVDITVVVAVDGGLQMPVLRNAASTPLKQLCRESAELAERARAGSLQPHEVSGGSFSISNPGPGAAQRFNALVSPPQAGIVAIGAAEDRPVVAAGGQLAVDRVVTATLTVDHRVIDGVLAAKLLGSYRRILEQDHDRLFA